MGKGNKFNNNLNWDNDPLFLDASVISVLCFIFYLPQCLHWNHKAVLSEN